MTQIVGYFEDFETEERRKEAYSEGPFVLCSLPGGGHRIEVEFKERNNPVLLDLTICKLLDTWGYIPGSLRFKFSALEHVCASLNREVIKGKIVRHKNGKHWIAPDFERRI